MYETVSAAFIKNGIAYEVVPFSDGMAWSDGLEMGGTIGDFVVTNINDNEDSYLATAEFCKTVLNLKMKEGEK